MRKPNKNALQIIDGKNTYIRSLKSLLEFGFEKQVVFKTNFTEEDDDTEGNGNSIKGFYTSNNY